MSEATSNANLALEERLRFETLIADLSSKFVDLPSGEVGREIENAQHRICDLLGFDFSALWQGSAEHPGSFALTHFYSSAQGPQPPERMTQEQYPWARRQLSDGRVIKVVSLEELPPAASRDRETLRRFGIKSNLALPLSVGGEVPIGILGFGTTLAERAWPDALVQRLQLLAQVFANALARKRSDQALRESQERLSLAADSAGAGLWELDCGTQDFWLTEQARVMFGYSPGEVITLARFKESVHPGDWALVQRSLDRSFQADEPVNVEYRIRLGDGHERWVSSRGRPFFKSNGESKRLVGLSMDITERKLADAAFRATEARLAAGADLVGLGYYEVDFGEPCCFIDDKFHEICGVPPGRHSGLAALELWMARLHPEDRQQVLDERERLHAGSIRQIAIDYRYLHPTQGQKWIQHLARVAARNASGRTIRSFGVVRDITAQKQAELETKILQGELAHSGRVTLLGQLASALAHELSQPLGAILRNAEAAEIMLQADPPDWEELRAIVADILRDDQRAGQVIDRLRALLKHRNLDLQPIDLSGVIGEVVSLVRADAVARKVKLASFAEPGLPAVWGDRIHLQQVLLNLFLNAMDAMDQSVSDRRAIEVRVFQTNPTTVEVEVRDNGPGIPDEHLARLFEPFFTTKIKGMGMGLAISKTIIGAHQGKLWVENQPEGGACFRFTLPVSSRASDR